MTNKELLIQILRDGAGLCITDIVTKIDTIIEAQEKHRPGSSKGFYEELTQADAEIRLELMRTNREGIVNWVLIAHERAVTLNPQCVSHK